MRSWSLLIFALIACLPLACTSQPKRSYASWLPRLRATRGPEGDDVVQMDVALIEARIGDTVLNDTLWIPLDEQFLPFEQKHLLEENGLRVAKVGASPPSELLALLTSERSCSDPRRMQLRAGNASRPIVLGSRREKCEFDLHKMDKETESVNLDDAEVFLEIVPTLTEDGRTKLKITPQIRHGAMAWKLWKPKADRSGWMMQLARPKQVYESLSWEVTLAPGEYVVIGGRYDRAGTLGRQAFVRTDEPSPVQRLVVLRTARSLPGVGERHLNKTVSEKRTAAPLALQAGMSVRGTSH